MQPSDVYSEAAVGCQRFTRQFEQDSLVHSSKVSHIQDRPLSLGRGAIYPPFAATLTVLNMRRTRWVTSLFYCQRITNLEDGKNVPQRLKPAMAVSITARLKPCPSRTEFL